MRRFMAQMVWPHNLISKCTHGVMRQSPKYLCDYVTRCEFFPTRYLISRFGLGLINGPSAVSHVYAIRNQINQQVVQHRRVGKTSSRGRRLG